MSALYGTYVNNGTIDLDVTMADLGIDDIPPLTEQEKTATVRDCLQACSGVYHTAEAESDGMHEVKPDRDSYLPGTFWIYNNWDFNVLRTIFEQQTGTNFYHALKNDILDPIGAKFEITDSISWAPTRSIHPAYMFQISATDMARFGQLMLQNGNWEGNQLIPENWIEESTRYYWDAEIYSSDGYGYMWWVATNHNRYPYLPNCSLPAGTFSARGVGGQWIEIIPEYDMVFVHRTDTYQGHDVSPADIGIILQLILNAKIN
jgi:CubicO group peptidase (beta-lactamase class C family)